MWTQTDIDRATEELTKKSLVTIQEETAYAWGARALAALSLWQTSGNAVYLGDALEYRHESLEHASLAGPNVYLAVWMGLQKLEQYV